MLKIERLISIRVMIINSFLNEITILFNYFLFLEKLLEIKWIQKKGHCQQLVLAKVWEVRFICIKFYCKFR